MGLCGGCFLEEGRKARESVKLFLTDHEERTCLEKVLSKRDSLSQWLTTQSPRSSENQAFIFPHLFLFCPVDKYWMVNK